jgi:predicted RNA-binding protein with PUA-like domain
MAYWLIKQEPTEFDYDDLVSSGSTVWDGVKNALAQQHLRAMKAGDRAFFYHTGDEKAIVGICKIIAGPTPVEGDDSLVTITVAPDQWLPNPVTLAAIKADGEFDDWELVKQSRLSVMPCSPAYWKRIVTMAKQPSGKLVGR